MSDERGQALVELLAIIPALLLVSAVAFQLLVIGYCSVQAGAAAEAGALALAGGGDARASVRQALPGWSRARASVAVGSTSVRVRLRPPSPLRAVSRRFVVDASAGLGDA